MPALSKSIKRHAIISSSIWTVVVVCSFAWSYSQQKINVLEIAKSEARIAFQKDTLYRKWAAKHGGVYVPVTPESQPNPYLSADLERNISTPLGKVLTLINPAYMTRQVFELAVEEHMFVRGHITSLNPIRPENAPDQWERTALAAFEKGVEEVSNVQPIDGQQYLRLMRPFKVEQPCLKCHAAQGYKEGDIRGGISVSVPLKALSANSERIIAGTGTAHGLIWLIGIGVIGLGSRKLSRNELALHEKNLQLAAEITDRQFAQEALQEQAVMLEEEIAERTRAEADIILSEEKFSKTFQNAPLMMAITIIEDGTFLEINNKFVELSGYSRVELIGKTSLELGWIRHSDWDCIVAESQRHGRVSGMDLNVCTKDGRQLITQYYGELFPIENQTRLLSVFVDVTEQRKVEDQLIHSQKMETIGALAGGVAHDFNNVLTVIAGYASLLSMRLEKGSENSAMAGEISASVERAAEMTRSLLAFSRKEPMKTKPEDVNTIITALEKSLKRLIREDIEFRSVLSDQPTPVMADKGQLEQVLINLVVNARDAMPSGGTLSISTSIIEFNAGESELDDGMMPGKYCLISVSDSGMGMNRDTLDHIFEPFFTTKETNKGTGLGLSIVHGIVAKHNGKINVNSEKGQGTLFRIYLPLLNKSKKSEQPQQSRDYFPRGDETILLADDDAAVRNVTTMLLEDSGYKVLVADNGETALSIYQKRHEEIRLLITDVIMPKMNGIELLEEVYKINANARVIVMSGYTDQIMNEKLLTLENALVLSKPLKSSMLMLSVRQLLDAGAIH